MVVCLGRRPYNRHLLRSDANLTKEPLKISVLKKFVVYKEMQITEKSHYNDLKSFIFEHSTNNTKHIYYLAIGPEILATVANISESNLISYGNLNHAIVFENRLDIIYNQLLKSIKCYGNTLMNVKFIELIIT